jgi:hypothetical protein
MKYHQHSASRSPSPSVVPTTPRDGPLDLVSPADLADPSEELEHLEHLDLDSTKARGRQANRKDGHAPLPNQGHNLNQAVGQLSIAMAAAEAEAMMRSDSFASASTSDSVRHSSSSTSRSGRDGRGEGGDGAEKSFGLLLRRRAASSQPPQRHQRPTSSPPTAGPRMLNVAPPTPLDPFLTPASVTATATTLLVNRSRSAHPRG